MDVIFTSSSEHPVKERSVNWTLQLSAKPIRDGDLICLLQRALKPTVIRLCKGYFVIIMISASPLENGRPKDWWQKTLQSVKVSVREFLLVWEWKYPLEKLQGLGEYESLLQTNDLVSEHLKIGTEHDLDKATRIWNIAIIVDDLGDYEKADVRLQEAMGGYEIAPRQNQSYMPKHNTVGCHCRGPQGTDIV